MLGWCIVRKTGSAFYCRCTQGPHDALEVVVMPIAKGSLVQPVQQLPDAVRGGLLQNVLVDEL
jgi:hypothetical protein